MILDYECTCNKCGVKHYTSPPGSPSDYYVRSLCNNCYLLEKERLEGVK